MTRARIAIALVTALVASAAAAASAPAATVKRYAFMDGRLETRAGDADGHARVAISLDRARGRVCFDLRKFKLETATAMHVHRGRAGSDGPTVVTFFSRPTGAGRGRVTGCVNGVSRATIDAILARSPGYYVDVHTAAYPSGSVRGQLTTRRLV